MFSVCSHLGEGTPSPSHNTSTGPIAFLRSTPSPSSNTSTGPMSFPLGTPVAGPRSLLGGGYPSPSTPGYPPARSGWGTASVHYWMGYLIYPPMTTNYYLSFSCELLITIALSYDVNTDTSAICEQGLMINVRIQLQNLKGKSLQVGSLQK